MDDLVSSAQAAELLGVRLQTVYAYVSRGLLTRVPGSTRARGTRLRRQEVLALADARHRQRAGALELRLDTAITRINPDGELHYRGIDVAELVREAFEDVFDLVVEQPGEWRVPDLEVADRVRAIAPAGASGADIMRLTAALLVAQRPDTGDRSPETFASEGRLLARTGSLAMSGEPADSIAAQISSVTGMPIDVVGCALVTLADHDLATSTVAARAAAGTGTRPTLALLAGLAALSGPRHGAASIAAVDWVRGALRRGPQAGIDQLPAAGFGHLVYAQSDPRFELITDALRVHDERIAGMLDQIALHAVRHSLPVPNVDLALAATIVAFDAPLTSGETIFATARIAGWSAHAIEESTQPLRFRPRGAYVGE